MPNNVLFIIFAVISSLEAIVIIIGNALTIFVFWSQKLSLRRTSFLLINLAIADLIVGITEPIVLATVDIPNSEAVRAQETDRIENLSTGFQYINRQSMEHNLRLSKTFFIVVVLSLVFWLPSIVVYTIREFCPSCFSPTWKWFVKPLQLANSMVNPFAYSFRMPMFKDALKRFWRKRRQNKELKPVQTSGMVLGKRGSFTLQMGHRVSTADIALTGYRHSNSSL